MMQNIATTKSEVAAFATSAQTNSFSGSGSNEQFGKIMQDQKTLHTVNIKSEAPPPHSRRKQALQQSLDKLDKAPVTTKKEPPKTQEQSTTNEQAKTPSLLQDRSAKQADPEYKVSEKNESVTYNLKGELEVDNADSELALSAKPNDIESPGEPTDIVAQDWIALVDNLQKLVDISPPTEQPLVGEEVQAKDASEGDLKSNDLNVTEEENSIPQVKGSNVEQSISILVDQALSEVLVNSELTELEVREKVANLLLETPEVLQDLLSKLPVASQKNGSEITQPSTDDTKIEKVIEKDPILTKQKIETGEQVDFTLAENKDLLRALLVDSDREKNYVQEPVKLATAGLPDTQEKSLQGQIKQPLITPLEVVAKLDEHIEQDVQEESSLLPNLTKIDKVASNNDIKNILNLSDNQQNKVLQNIVQRVFDSNETGEPISPEQLVQPVVIPKVAKIISSVESPAKNFISALKSGLEEFKAQLSQGREPGIDLKALVSDALEKATDTGAVAKAPVNLEQVVNRVSQMLDFAQSMNRAIEHHHDQAYSNTIRDVAQIQGEQSKQIQLNQFAKAINIAKPEGHQQLAEKVQWMVNSKNLVAEIRLDPAELGSVHVKVVMSGESATVTFVVQSQQARDAVDTATPRLKEMLAEKGIELGQSSVRQESDTQQEQGDGELARQGESSQQELDEAESPEQFPIQQKIVNGAIGGIDYFV